MKIQGHRKGLEKGIEVDILSMKSITQISTKNKFQDNPRIITGGQFTHLKNHLQDFGDLSGVVYCHNNKCFVGGNQRSEVFNGAKIEISETFNKPTESGTIAHGFIIYNGEKFAYREVCFSEDDFKKACIVANNDGGSFNWEVLENEWDSEQLQDWGLDIGNTEDIDLDQFFEEDPNKETNLKNKIVLEYSEKDFTIINEKFNELDGSKEDIVWKLLGL